jgi:hypothetical protein
MLVLQILGDCQNNILKKKNHGKLQINEHCKSTILPIKNLHFLKILIPNYSFYKIFLE